MSVSSSVYPFVNILLTAKTKLSTSHVAEILRVRACRLLLTMDQIGGLTRLQYYGN